MSASSELHELLQDEAPSLEHFLQQFLNRSLDRWIVLEELTRKIHESQRPLPTEPVQRRAALFKGLIQLTSRKHPETMEEVLQGLRNTVYEEIQVEPLPAEFFNPDAIPSRATIQKLRNSQLNRSRRMLLDMVFLEGLGSKYCSQVTGISEMVLEAFLLTLFQELSAASPPQDLDELKLFQSLMQGEPPPVQDTEFSPRALRLMQGLRMNVRQTRENLALKLTQSIDPNFQRNAQPEPQPSVIASIRARNEKRRQSAEEGPDVVQQTEHKKTADHQWALKMVKPAGAVLFLFFATSLYQTFQSGPSETAVQTSTKSETVALANTAQAARAILRQGNRQWELLPGDAATASGLQASLNDTAMQAILEPGCHAVWFGPGKLHVHKGSMQAQSTSSLPIELSTAHGTARGEQASVLMASIHPGLSLAGVESGQAKLFHNHKQSLLQQGEQIHFGPQSESTQIEPLLKPGFHAGTNRTPSRPALNNLSSFSDPHTPKAALTREVLIKEPQRKARHFQEKL